MNDGKHGVRMCLTCEGDGFDPHTVAECADCQGYGGFEPQTKKPARFTRAGFGDNTRRERALRGRINELEQALVKLSVDGWALLPGVLPRAQGDEK